MMIKKSKINVSPEKFYTIEEIKLNYHVEYLVYEENKRVQGEYFKTLKEALQYVTDKCEW